MGLGDEGAVFAQMKTLWFDDKIKLMTARMQSLAEKYTLDDLKLVQQTLSEAVTAVRSLQQSGKRFDAIDLQEITNKLQMKFNDQVTSGAQCNHCGGAEGLQGLTQAHISPRPHLYPGIASTADGGSCFLRLIRQILLPVVDSETMAIMLWIWRHNWKGDVFDNAAVSVRQRNTLGKMHKVMVKLTKQAMLEAVLGFVANCDQAKKATGLMKRVLLRIQGNVQGQAFLSIRQSFEENKIMQRNLVERLIVMEAKDSAEKMLSKEVKDHQRPQVEIEALNFELDGLKAELSSKDAQIKQQLDKKEQELNDILMTRQEAEVSTGLGTWAEPSKMVERGSIINVQELAEELSKLQTLLDSAKEREDTLQIKNDQLRSFKSMQDKEIEQLKAQLVKLHKELADRMQRINTLGQQKEALEENIQLLEGELAEHGKQRDTALISSNSAEVEQAKVQGLLTAKTKEANKAKYDAKNSEKLREALARDLMQSDQRERLEETAPGSLRRNRSQSNSSK